MTLQAQVVEYLLRVLVFLTDTSPKLVPMFADHRATCETSDWYHHD